MGSQKIFFRTKFHATHPIVPSFLFANFKKIFLFPGRCGGGLMTAATSWGWQQINLQENLKTTFAGNKLTAPRSRNGYVTAMRTPIFVFQSCIIGVGVDSVDEHGVIIVVVVEAGRTDVEGGQGTMCGRSPVRRKKTRMDGLKLGDRLLRSLKHATCRLNLPLH